MALQRSEFHDMLMIPSYIWLTLLHLCVPCCKRWRISADSQASGSTGLITVSLDAGVEHVIHPSSQLQVVHSFHYLGVAVQLTLNSYIANNVCPVNTQLQQYIVQWMNQPLDLMGRVNLLKTIFLPKR